MPAAVPGSLMRGKKIRARATIKLGGTGCTGLTGRARALSSPVLHPPPRTLRGQHPRLHATSQPHCRGGTALPCSAVHYLTLHTGMLLTLPTFPIVLRQDEEKTGKERRKSEATYRMAGTSTISAAQHPLLLFQHQSPSLPRKPSPP